jgi:hypothetical protein
VVAVRASDGRPIWSSGLGAGPVATTAASTGPMVERQPVHDESDVTPAGSAPGKSELPAKHVGAFVEHDVVTPRGGDARRFQASRSATDDQHPAADRR